MLLAETEAGRVDPDNDWSVFKATKQSVLCGVVYKNAPSETVRYNIGYSV